MDSIKPEFSWFNPFALGATPLVGGILLGIFIYWGWDSGVAVNEESENPAEGPGRAAVLSTVLLVLIYVLVTVGRAGRRRHAVPRQQRRRRAQPARRPGSSAPASAEVPALLRADLGLGVHPDDDPADRPHDDLDGQLGRAAEGLRARPPALSDAERLDAGDGRRVDRLDGRAAADLLPGQRAGRLDHGPRLRDPLLLRLHRPRLRRSTSARSCSRARAARCSSGWCRSSASPAWSTSSSRPSSPSTRRATTTHAPLLGIQVPIVIGIGGLLLGLVFMVAQWIFMPDFFRRSRRPPIRRSSRSTSPHRRTVIARVGGRRPRRAAAADARLLRLL